MTDSDAIQLELQIQAKQLRFRMVETAIALGLTLNNLAQVEASMGNDGQASWASENARRVHREVQDCLSTTDFNAEERKWAIKNLSQLELAISAKDS